ncbi:uncharacterized protein [Drosophila kikkawai]|uniref:Uncharacterized protein n=1 Tax=Drosophila kikkawai TaxID=30033 RepID=A0A6P4IAR6_DROKI|nr:inner centromere protein A [Drosophila kikkawai]
MNNEFRLQISKLLVVQEDLDSLGETFESAYSLDGKSILPPLMTDVRRLEMQQLRLRALTKEVILKRNKLNDAEKQLKRLMPRMVNASTNTALTENPNPSPNLDSIPNSNTVPVSTFPLPIFTPAPLIVMGRFRQELQKSETAVYDHSTKELVEIAPPKTLPISTATQVIIEDAPQLAVILPVELGTMKSSWVPKTFSSTTIDLRELTSQERLPERPEVFPSSNQIPEASPKTPERKFRSQIPVWRHRATVLPTVQPPEVTITASGHGSLQERNSMKSDNANERRRSYGAKVALKRNEMTRKREELAKLKPPPRTTNCQVPKSIRTPIRRVEVGESMVEQQRFRVQESPRTDNNNNQVPKSIRTPIRRVEVGESALEQQRLQVQESPKTDNSNQVIKSIRTPIRRVEMVFEKPEVEQENTFQSLDQQPISTNTYNNQVPKSIRTPIRRAEGGESKLEQQRLQIQELLRTNNNNDHEPKSNRTPIRRVEAEESTLEQQHLQIQESPETDNNNNHVSKSIRTPFRRVEVVESSLEQQRLQIQETPKTDENNSKVPKSIRTLIRRVKMGFEKSEKEQQESLCQSLDLQQTFNNQVSKSLRIPISRVDGGESQHDKPLQIQESPVTDNNNNQIKSIRTPIRRMAAGIDEPELLKQMHLFQSLTSRQKAEQQRLQDQLEQQQQGLIDQLVGQLAPSDSQDTPSEVVVDPADQ